jgi:signal transduction histidine kinase
MRPHGTVTPRDFETAALEKIEEYRAESLRISQMLHDDVAQMLSSAGLQLDILRMDLEAQTPEIAARTAEIQAMLEGVVEKVRLMSQRLGPIRIERFGLRPALDALVGLRRQDYQGTLRLLFDSKVAIPAPCGAAFYRIAELALDNAVRHARASHIEVVIKGGKRGPVLEVRDDGVGFDTAAVPRGLGLALMEFVAARAGLGFRISRLRERWTVVAARC